MTQDLPIDTGLFIVAAVLIVGIYTIAARWHEFDAVARFCTVAESVALLSSFFYYIYCFRDLEAAPKYGPRFSLACVLTHMAEFAYSFSSNQISVKDYEKFRPGILLLYHLAILQLMTKLVRRQMIIGRHERNTPTHQQQRRGDDEAGLQQEHHQRDTNYECWSNNLLCIHGSMIAIISCFTCFARLRLHGDSVPVMVLAPTETALIVWFIFSYVELIGDYCNLKAWGPLGWLNASGAVLLLLAVLSDIAVTKFVKTASTDAEDFIIDLSVVGCTAALAGFTYQHSQRTVTDEIWRTWLRLVKDTSIYAARTVVDSLHMRNYLHFGQQYRQPLV